VTSTQLEPQALGAHDELHAASHIPPRTLARTVLHATVDSAFLTIWHAQGARMRRSRPRLPVTFQHAPILVLPGVFESPTFLDPLVAVIRTTGRPIHRIDALGSNLKRIDESAGIVREYLASNALQNVTIVAHSKGGLIGKQLMVWPESAERIRSMIAIATPFGGSRYASHAPLRALRDFAPADAVLRGLAANDDANARILSVFGAFDPEIPDGSRLPGGRNEQLSTAGHFRPLGDPQLHRLLCRELTSELTSELTISTETR